uniref:Uncharacterized protein n=1 Tax=Oryza sativa subsp. japonica TaxID=39947 RepID=Q6AV08_ORYSJ|nr:hypothetical protein [Oryza sativa Japonica Group]
MIQSNKFKNLNSRFASLGTGMTQRYKFRRARGPSLSCADVAGWQEDINTFHISPMRKSPCFRLRLGWQTVETDTHGRRVEYQGVQKLLVAAAYCQISGVCRAARETRRRRMELGGEHGGVAGWLQLAASGSGSNRTGRKWHGDGDGGGRKGATSSSLLISLPSQPPMADPGNTAVHADLPFHLHLLPFSIHLHSVDVKTRGLGDLLNSSAGPKFTFGTLSMRGNHLEAYQLNLMTYTKSYCRNRLYRLTQPDSDLADPDRSRFGLQLILTLFPQQSSSLIPL